MIELLLRDAEAHPGVFFWRGPLSADAIKQWEHTRSLIVPEDLRQLWFLKGGCDLFESETILQPFGGEEYDLIESVSSVFWGNGLSSEYLVFHIGVVDSAFRKSDGALFSMEPLDHMTQFKDLDDWYSKTLRNVFEERYLSGRS